jgi:hypothetical protein
MWNRSTRATHDGLENSDLVLLGKEKATSDLCHRRFDTMIMCATPHPLIQQNKGISSFLDSIDSVDTLFAWLALVRHDC